MFKIYLDNRIAYDGANYKCYLCDVEIPFTTEIDCHSVLKHLLNERHHQKLKSIDKSRRNKETQELCTVSTSEWTKIVKNHVTFDSVERYFRCYVCECSIEGVSNAVAHIDSTLHRMQCLKIYAKQNYTSEELPKNSSTQGTAKNYYLESKLKTAETAEQINSSRLLNVKSHFMKMFHCKNYT